MKRVSFGIKAVGSPLDSQIGHDRLGRLGRLLILPFNASQAGCFSIGFVARVGFHRIAITAALRTVRFVRYRLKLDFTKA